MSVNNNFINSVPSLYQPLATLFPAPIVAKRAPTANDINYPLGQVWIYPALNEAFFLTSVTAGAATWEAVTGGAGVFTSLTVNPGPTSLSTVGNGNVLIGNAANTGTVQIDAGVGNFVLNGNGHTIGIGTDAAANTLLIGSLTAGASTTLQAGTGNMAFNTEATSTIAVNASSGAMAIHRAVNVDAAAGVNAFTSTSLTTGVAGIFTSSGPTVDAIQAAGGGISVPVVSNVAGASPVTVNARHGQAIFTDVINAGAYGTLTITNSTISATSIILANSSCATVNSACSVVQIAPGAGSVAITIFNGGAANTGDNILVNFWNMSA